MANRKVAIYEGRKRDGEQEWTPVEMPNLKPDGSVYLKHDRIGNFYISWYEGKSSTTGFPRKRWKKVTGSQKYKSGKPYTTLEDAVKAARAKEWELQYPERVKPVIPDDPRITLSVAIYKYVQDLGTNEKTVKEHRTALKAFEQWTTVTYVDEITRAMLLKWYAKLVRDGNDKLTAVWKLIRVNKFYKTIMGLPHGHGLIKTTEPDFKAQLKRKPKISVYSADDLKKFFAACDTRQWLLFQLYHKCGLRNKELAHLEWPDLDLDKREVDIHQKKVQDGDVKKPWGPKHGSEGKVVIPELLIEPLKKWKERATNLRGLVFPTRNGRVNSKLLDQCKLVARHAGLDETKWTIKSFRATYATNRLRSRKYDTATLREQLRHKDQTSIEHYTDYLRNEELIASGKVDEGWDA
jgi:integrase